MVSLFSGGWGPGFAPVVQVEYRGDGDGDMAGFCGGEVQVLQRGGRWAYLKSNNVTLLSLDNMSMEKHICERLVYLKSNNVTLLSQRTMAFRTHATDNLLRVLLFLFEVFS
ncbi:hypothetical protein ACQJBY_029318 [Aegilops geniculata]